MEDVSLVVGFSAECVLGPGPGPGAAEDNVCSCLTSFFLSVIRSSAGKGRSRTKKISGVTAPLFTPRREPGHPDAPRRIRSSENAAWEVHTKRSEEEVTVTSLTVSATLRF